MQLQFVSQINLTNRVFTVCSYNQANSVRAINLERAMIVEDAPAYDTIFQKFQVPQRLELSTDLAIELIKKNVPGWS